MSVNALYACVHAAEFPAQALLRLRPDLRSAPVAVIEGRPPQEFVCAMNRPALQNGASLGMARLDVEGMGGVRLLARSLETEAAARSVLLECVARFSPRIEEASRGTASRIRARHQRHGAPVWSPRAVSRANALCIG